MDKYQSLVERKQAIRDDEREEFQGKLNLLSGIANLSFIIGMNTT